MTIPTISDISAFILAGGLGTRLRPVVTDRPKVLADVNGRPFLEHLLDQLEEYGLHRVVLCTGYLGEQIEAKFGAMYKGLKLEYSRETEPLGTGGALRLAASRLAAGPALVLNGDSFCRLDFRDFLKFHVSHRAAISLAVTEVQDISRYGAVDLGPEGRITRFEEKGAKTGTGLINAGVYLIQRDVIVSIPQNTMISLEKEVLSPTIGVGLYGFIAEGGFIDIGIPSDYVAAQRVFPYSPG